jgi:hypothetical protein
MPRGTCPFQSGPARRKVPPLLDPVARVPIYAKSFVYASKNSKLAYLSLLIGGITITTGSFLRSNCTAQYRVSAFGRTTSVKLAFTRSRAQLFEDRVLAGPRPIPGGTFGLVTKLNCLSIVTRENPHMYAKVAISSGLFEEEICAIFMLSCSIVVEDEEPDVELEEVEDDEGIAVLLVVVVFNDEGGDDDDALLFVVVAFVFGFELF